MSKHINTRRDAFGFSLQGLRSTAAYAAVMAVADDGINYAWDEKLRAGGEEAGNTDSGMWPAGGRFWLSRHYRAR
jgi:hypothetical protein